MAPMALEKENHTRDADFMSAMHGKSASSQAGFSSMLKKDHASFFFVLLDLDADVEVPSNIYIRQPLSICESALLYSILF